MLSRIFWIGIAGLALIAGIIIQDGGGIISWGDSHDSISARAEQSIKANIERAVEASVGKMKVVGSDGEEIDLPPETKTALLSAVGRLVKAETDLAFIRARDGSAEDQRAAEAQSAQARAEVDRLKAEIEHQNKGATIEGEALTEQIQREVREDIRAKIRESVRN